MQFRGNPASEIGTEFGKSIDGAILAQRFPR
jgi:hypothetical protein